MIVHITPTYFDPESVVGGERYVDELARHTVELSSQPVRVIGVPKHRILLMIRNNPFESPMAERAGEAEYAASHYRKGVAGGWRNNSLHRFMRLSKDGIHKLSPKP